MTVTPTPVEPLSRHFAWEETAVSRSHPELVVPVPEHKWDVVHALATTVLDPLRDQHGGPLTVLSWYRSEALNAAVGGSPTSQHRMGAAADVTGARITSLFRELVAKRFTLPAGQMIFYPDKHFIHAALPSARYPTLSLHVHRPTRGIVYRRIHMLGQFDWLVHT